MSTTRDPNDRAKAGETPDLDAPGVVMPDADPELARLGALLTGAATGPEVDRAGVQAEVLRALARRAGSGALEDPTEGEDDAEAWRRIYARAEGQEACLPVPWRDLARVLNPHATDGRALYPGVHVLVGGTGSGKTQLALGLALAAARGGHPVWYVGLELDRVSVTARLAAVRWATHPLNAARAVVPWSVLNWPETSWGRGRLDEVGAAVRPEARQSAIRRVFAAARTEHGGFTVADLDAVLTKAKAVGTVERPALVVFDFLQLLAPQKDGLYDDREIRTRIAQASYIAGNATRDGTVAVLLVSATSREGYTALELTPRPSKLKDHWPPPGSLVGTGKESGEIEYAATSVLVLAQVKGHDETRALAVAKNRYGRLGWIALDFRAGSVFLPAPEGTLDRLRTPQNNGEGEEQEDTGRKATRRRGTRGPNP